MQKDKASVASAQQSLATTKQKDEESVTSAQQSLASTVQKDDQALVSDESSLTSTEQKDEQSLEQAEDQVTTAEQQVSEADEALSTSQTGQSATVSSDRASLASAQSSLAEARQNVADAVLRSPISGTITSLDLESGQSVAAGNTSVSTPTSSSSSSSSTSAATSSSSSSSADEVVIRPEGAFVVEADATTAQIGEVLDGEQAVISPTGSTSDYYGIVTSFSTTGTTSSGVTSFPVTVAVTGSTKGLYPGASADVELVVKQVNNVLEIPTSAVHTLGTSSYVDILKNGKEVQQAITVGAASGTETQVETGLKSGQQVVLVALSAKIPSSTGLGSGGGLTGGGFPSGGISSGGFSGGPP
jgi:multidrug efflux pump subunit AcrA (membrane-fusion protein)